MGRIRKAATWTEQRLFLQSAARPAGLELLAVFAAASIIAFFRLGAAALAGRPWAEDGAVFIQQTVDSGLLRPLTFDYAGYLSVGPRLVSSGVALFPLEWRGVGMHLGAALVGGAVSLTAYVSLRGQLPGRFARLAVAGYAVAVPLGTETAGSVANLQWFLVFGALTTVYWTPRGRWGWAWAAIICVIAVTSSPFAVIVLLACLVRWFLQRGRGQTTVLITVLVAFLVQSYVMVKAPERVAVPGAMPGLHPRLQVRGYLSRVLGDGVFGVGHLPQTPVPSIRLGALVLLAMALLVAFTWGNRLGFSTLAFTASLLALSVLTYAAPIVASGLPTDAPYAGGRYYVTPALLAATAVVALIVRAGSLVNRQTAVRRRTFASYGGALVASATVIAAVFGVVSSFDLSELGNRDRGRPWAASIRAERSQCRGRPDSAAMSITTPPAPSWTVHLTCGALR